MSDEIVFSHFIARIRAGDQRAAAELVTQYEPVIRREIRMNLHDRNLVRVFDSMDICQSVLASFFVRTAAGEYDIGTEVQLVGLLVDMARNKLISAARHEYTQRRDLRRRTGEAALDLDSIPDRDRPLDEQIDCRDLLCRIYDRMTPEELRISKLRSSGAAWEEVAAEMGGTPQSRRMQFSRAVDRLAGELDLDFDE
jgi:RNA polymerase sigma-70 factor (ECF subfamily)